MATLSFDSAPVHWNLAGYRIRMAHWTNTVMVPKTSIQIALPEAWLLALSVVGYPVAGLLAAAMNCPSQWTSAPFRATIAFLALWVFLLAWRRGPLPARWAWALLLWLSVYGLRLIHNVLEGYVGARHELLFVVLAVYLPVIALFKANLDEVEVRLIPPLAWLATITVTFAVIGEYLGWFGANSMTFTGRLSTTTVNPITLGHAAVTLLLTTVAWQVRGAAHWRWLLAALVPLALAGLSMSGSRGPFAALFVALAVYVLAAPLNGHDWLIGRAPVLLVIVAAGYLFLQPLPMNHLIEQSYLTRISAEQGNLPFEKHAKLKSILQRRLAALHSQEQRRRELIDTAATSRLALMEASWNAMLRHPLIGVSNWAANVGKYPHNLTLEAFQNLGIFGGLSFLALLVTGFLRAWQRLRTGQMIVPLLFFQGFVACQFSGSLYANANLWLTLSLLLGAGSPYAKHTDLS